MPNTAQHESQARALADQLSRLPSREAEREAWIRNLATLYRILANVSATAKNDRHAAHKANLRAGVAEGQASELRSAVASLEGQLHRATATRPVLLGEGTLAHVMQGLRDSVAADREAAQ